MTESQDIDVTLDLLHAARGGNRTALDELFERYSGRVLTIARARLGRGLRRRLESRDILQEALAEAFQSFDRFEVKTESAFLHWIAQIVEHAITRKATYFSAQKRDDRGALSVEGPGTPDATSPEISVPDDGETPSMTIGGAEEQAIVTECLGDLPDRYREVILLRDYAGASWDEVARHTEHPTTGATRMTHARAKRALGKLLRDRGLA